MRFAMTLDRLHKVVTVLVLLLVPAVLLVGLGAMFGDGAADHEPVGFTVYRAGLLFTLVLFALVFAWAPCGVEIFGGTLRVERRLWPALELTLSEIASVEPGFEIKRSGIRVFGDGGFFGSYGWFWNRQLGLYRMYTTRLGQGVVVRLKHGKPVVICVDEPDRFYEALSSRV